MKLTTASLLFVAIVPGVLLFLDRRRVDSELADLRRQSTRLNAALDESKGTQAPLVQILRVPVPDKAVEPEPGSAASATERGSPPPVAPPPPSDDEYREFLKAGVESETYDGQWAAGAKREIESFFGGAPGSVVRGVDCRSTMCKVDILHRDEGSSSAFRNTLMKWHGALTWHPDSPGPDGSVASSLIVMRQGTALPLPPEEPVAHAD